MFSLLLATGDEGAGMMALVLMVPSALVGALFWCRAMHTMARICACITGLMGSLLLLDAFGTYYLPGRGWCAAFGLVGIVASLALFFTERKEKG